MEKPSQKILVGVISSVIAGLILRYTTGITPLDIVYWTGKFLKACWDSAFDKVSVARWLLWLLASISVLAVVFVIRGIIRGGTGPSPIDYREDCFEGLIWRWRFGGGTILDTWCFCPSCDSILVYREDSEQIYNSEIGWRDVTHFTCEHCQEKKATLEGRRDRIISRIERQIDRKIRVGEWRTVVEAKSGKVSNA